MKKLVTTAFVLTALSSSLAVAGGTSITPAPERAAAPAPAPAMAAPAPAPASVAPAPASVAPAPVSMAPASATRTFIPFSYFGVGAGRSEADINAAALGAGARVVDSDTAWKLFAGHRLHPNVAVDISYTDLGQASVTIPAGSTTIEADALAFDLVGVLPVSSRLDVFGKLGVARWDAESSGLVRAQRDGTDGHYGVGTSFSLSPNAALRAEWERFQDIGDNTDVDVTSASFVWKF